MSPLGTEHLDFTSATAGGISCSEKQ